MRYGVSISLFALLITGAVGAFSFWGVADFTIDSAASDALLLLRVELIIALILSTWALWKMRSASPYSQEVLKQPTARYLLMLFACLLVILYGELFSSGRPVQAVGLVMPGSLLSRLFLFGTEAWVRRLFEPTLWVLVIVWWHISCGPIYSARVAARAVVLMVFFEATLLHPVSDPFSGSPVVSYGHFFLYQVILCAVISMPCEIVHVSRAVSPMVRSSRRAVLDGWCGVLLVVWAGSLWWWPAKELLVGAHYYSWFPKNWKGGYTREKLIPPQQPLLGEYSSRNHEVFLTHVNWARDAGIDFFIFDWWPQRLEVRRAVYSHLKNYPFPENFHFSVHYETSDLVERGDPSYAGERPEIYFMSDTRIWRLKKHWERLARYYMSNPAYLRVKGRPVLFMYATRHLIGPVDRAVREAKQHVKDLTGEDLFIVGDEVFFQVVGESLRMALC